MPECLDSGEEQRRCAAGHGLYPRRKPARGFRREALLAGKNLSADLAEIVEIVRERLLEATAEVPRGGVEGAAFCHECRACMGG